jgi:hypothetical protein
MLHARSCPQTTHLKNINSLDQSSGTTAAATSCQILHLGVKNQKLLLIKKGQIVIVTPEFQS